MAPSQCRQDHQDKDHSGGVQGENEVREPTLPIWWEQVMELGEKDRDEGPFLGWDN